MPLNKSILMGRLTADPNLRKTPDDIPVLSATIAVDRLTKGDKRIVDFIDFVAWRHNAEVIAKNFHKGDPIIIEGPIHIRNWTDKNGNKRRNAEIEITDFSFVPYRSQQDKDGAPAAEPDMQQLEEDTPLPWEIEE